MVRYYLFLVCGIFVSYISAQNIAINTTGTDPDASAMLDISGANHGLLVPRVALTATGAAGPVTSPAVSLLVYNTATVSDVTPGYYYWNGTTWVRFFDATVNAADHDWYEVGTTDSPSSISDNIFTQGNVGVGMTSPTANLHVSGSGGDMVFIEGTSSRTVLQMYYHNGSVNPTNGTIIGDLNFAGYFNGSYNPAAQEVALIRGIYTGDGTTRTGDLSFHTGNSSFPAERMRITNEGKVGIGTASPAGTLAISKFSTAGIPQLVVDYTYKNHSSDPVSNSPVSIRRTSSYDESMNIFQQDHGTVFHLRNDEEVGSIRFAVDNTDTETGGGVSANNNTVMSIVGDISGGSVGVGIISPTGKFHVNNDETGSDSSFVVLESGNVGIGTINPTSKLQIGEYDAGSVSSISVSGAATGTFEGGEIRLYTAADYDNLVDFFRADMYRNYFRIGREGFTDFVIDSIGNVGIGTTAPTAKLEIIPSTDKIIRNGEYGTNGLSSSNFVGTHYYWDTDNLQIGLRDYGADRKDAVFNIEQGSDNFRFQVAGTDRVFFEGGGNVGVGTTTPSSNFHVVRSGAGTIARFEVSDPHSTDVDITIKGSRTGAPTEDIASINLSNYDQDEGAGTEFVMSKIVGGMQDISGQTGYLKLMTNSGASLTEKMRIDKDGNVGIGTSSPDVKLHVMNSLKVERSNQLGQYISLVSEGAGGHYIDGKSLNINKKKITFRSIHDGVGVASGELGFRFQLGDASAPTSAMVIMESGNIGIGTTSPSEMLEVSGNVKATSFIATTAGAGAYQYNSGTNMTVPDYVFEKHFRGESQINPDYSMNTLKEVESYIQKNHHLPRVPSRDELLKDGVMNIQGMQMVTLEKVEELFIHSIEQEKRIVAQDKENELLKKELSAQEDRFSKEIQELREMVQEIQK